MSLVGGYGSDEGSGSSDGETAAPAATLPAPAVANGASLLASTGDGQKKRKVVINHAKLPVSKPLALDAADLANEDAPLKKAADLAARSAAGKSLLASLPAPRATLGGQDSSGGSGGVRIDLSALAPRPRKEQREAVAGALSPSPMSQLAAAHPMFGGGDSKLRADGPSLDDLHHMRTVPNFTKIAAVDIQDPDWFMKNQVSGGPGLHKGKNVAEEVSQYETSAWKKNSLSESSKTQKRKHQINWLAQEAIDNEAEMLDRNSQGKLTKSQTSMKYGW